MEAPPTSTPTPPQSSSSSSSTVTNPNPNPSSLQQQQQQNRSPFDRPWSQPPSQFSSSSSSSSSLGQRGGAIAMGLPALPVSSQSAVSFSSSFGPHYGVVSSSTTSPARPLMHGSQNVGIMGSQMRPGGVPPSALHQQRPVQPAPGIRPQASSNNQPSVPQNFQGHGILRASSVTPSSPLTTSTSQSQQSPHQPWLSAPHGRPPLPSQSFRPAVNSQSLQQRSHIPQQSPQPVPATSQPQQSLSSPQQQQHFPASNQSQENYGPQLSSSRVPQPLANQQTVRVPVTGQASIVNPGPTDKTGGAEAAESCSTILSKRSIQELVNQIDPSEKLDPVVEDVLIDIAEDFIGSVTAFGCSLAKHRKSNTLEAKDIRLHVERTWHMTLPGFSGDEIKTYKKPVANDIHKERLAVIKKSLAVAETGNNKSSAGPAAGHAKGHLAKV